MPILPACLMAVALVPVPPASNPIRVAEVARKVAAQGTTQEDRTAAVKELMGHDPAVVLPVLAAEIDGAADGVGDDFRGYGAERDPRAEVQAWLALHRLWDHHIHGKVEVVWVTIDPPDGVGHRNVVLVPTPDGKKVMTPVLKRFRSSRQQAAVGKVLTAILKDARSEHTCQLALEGLQYNYSPDAEAPLAVLLREEKSIGMMTAAKILIQQHPGGYGPLVINRLADTKRPVSERVAYLEVIRGIDMSALVAADRKRLVCAGFTVLAADRNYFTAGILEEFTGQQFTPDVNAAKYRNKDGNRKDTFFTDTVQNALDWWSANRSQYE